MSALNLLALGLALAAGPAAAAETRETAIFAGGCFWCVESDFEKVPGVVEAISGYTGGTLENPTYEQVSSGSSGHAESVQVIFDPARITYENLLEIFWRSIDPLTADAQFCDHGNQYRTAIFPLNDRQKRAAESSKERLQRSGRLSGPVVTLIVPASRFYPAEEYHQDYYKKNPIRYRFYRRSCGRDRRLKEVWGP